MGKPLKKQGITAPRTPNPRKQRKMRNPRKCTYRGVYLAKRNTQNHAALDRWSRRRNRWNYRRVLGAQRLLRTPKRRFSNRATRDLTGRLELLPRRVGASEQAKFSRLTRQNSKLESDLANEKANAERLTQQFKLLASRNSERKLKDLLRGQPERARKSAQPSAGTDQRVSRKS